jgi:hypothetical protein
MAQSLDPRIKDLENVRDVFTSLGVRFFVVYGVALGFHRDGTFLPGDDDIDLAVIDPIDLETRKKIGWKLYDLGFYPQNIAFNVFGRMEPVGLGYEGDHETGIIVCERNFKFTIFFFKPEECPQHGPEYVCVPKLGAMRLIATPRAYYEKPDSIKIAGKKYLVPGPVEDYLASAYFDNWKDKTDRRHSLTYAEHHAKESITKEEANSVQIWK